MVYKLYNLTYEEVKIIDPAFALSAKEYESYKMSSFRLHFIMADKTAGKPEIEKIISEKAYEKI